MTTGISSNSMSTSGSIPSGLVHSPSKFDLDDSLWQISVRNKAGAKQKYIFLSYNSSLSMNLVKLTDFKQKIFSIIFLFFVKFSLFLPRFSVFSMCLTKLSVIIFFRSINYLLCWLLFPSNWSQTMQKKNIHFPFLLEYAWIKKKLLFDSTLGNDICSMCWCCVLGSFRVNGAHFGYMSGGSYSNPTYYPYNSSTGNGQNPYHQGYYSSYRGTLTGKIQINS